MGQKGTRSTCNMIMNVQHPGESPYMDVAPSSGVYTHREVLMLEAPPLKNFEVDNFLVEE